MEQDAEKAQDSALIFMLTLHFLDLLYKLGKSF